MRRALRIGDRVARRDIPQISGAVIAMRNGQMRVQWSIHFAQWVDVNKLILTSNKTDKRGGLNARSQREGFLQQVRH